MALETLVLKGVCIGVVPKSTVGYGVELRLPAEAGHDSTDDARRLSATGLA